MRILAFAHVTFCVEFSSRFASDSGEILVDEVVLNHPEKEKIQKGSHKAHHLLLQHRNGLSVEFCSYPEARFATAWRVRSRLRINEVLRGQRILQSKSFSARFIKKLGLMTAEKPNLWGTHLDLPTLNPRQTVRISSSLVAPRFNRELDALGPVALAFWVDSLDSFPPEDSGGFEGLHPSTDVFPVTIGGRTINVAFARLEGVNIEFLCR